MCGFENLAPAPLPAQQQDEEERCPNKTMRENFRGRNGFEQLPINRNQSPCDEGGKAGDESGTFFAPVGS